MKTSRWIVLLYLAAPLSCNQADPTAPQLQNDSETFVVVRAETLTLHGGPYDPYAVDKNENGMVCGATAHGPYIDDVRRPPRNIKIRPNPNPNPNQPFLEFGCMSPAYPLEVFPNGF
jgi:hypothetical protein